MGASGGSTNKKYVFTQAAAPSGEGEIEGSLWYDTTGNELNTYDGAAWNTLTPSVGGEGGYISFMPKCPQSVLAGTWATLLDGATTGYLYFRNSSVAINDGLRFKAYLAAGTYSFFASGKTQSNCGKLHCWINGTDKGSCDFYSGAGTIEDVSKVDTGLVVATSGLYNVDFIVTSKNGSSSGYVMQINAIGLYRTA